MRNEKLFLTLLSVLAFLAVSHSFAMAQTRPETDPRFEKLAKDLYPKEKQEGALVVYTVWDVDHIRSLLAAFSKGFLASMERIGKRQDRRSPPEPSPNTKEISRPWMRSLQKHLRFFTRPARRN